MKIIYNKLIPLKGYSAINLFGVIFAKNKLSDRTINHERIHTAQIKELCYIFFYLWYAIEWLVGIVKYRSSKQAYRSISFEKEAHSNDDNLNYLELRKPFEFWNYY